VVHILPANSYNQSVVITGIGLISALGNLTSTWQHLLAGHSGIQLHQPFPEQPAYPLALMGAFPTSLPTLTQKLVSDALQDAGVLVPLPECGVVIGSSRSFQAQWEQLAKARVLGEDCLNLSAWIDTLPHSLALQVAQQIGTIGPVLAPMAACATGIWALAHAFELIQTGQCRQVIAGAVETPVTPLTLAGFHKMGALAKTGAYPFDHRRDGFVLGEGGAIFVLESLELALEQGRQGYGQILGFGITNDAQFANAPPMDGNSALLSIKNCYKNSQISSSTIDAIHAHGTGTQLNDQFEAQLIQSLFPQGVPVCSTKGATGHTLGASGALGTAFCLMALRQQILPPCIGLQQPAFPLDFVTKARSCNIENLLCFSFGFGGQNAVLALRKVEF
jgi:3-oxoacyl-[acyl-carrier-protein] synthase II